MGDGPRAANRPGDVRIVQHLLNLATRGPALHEDGRSSADLIRRIRQFQHGDLRFQHPDGRVDPGGRTLRVLLQRAAQAPRPAPRPAPTTKPASSLLDELESGMISLKNAMMRELSAMFRDRREATRLATPGAGAQPGSGSMVADAHAAAPIIGVTDADFVSAAARLGAGIDPLLVRAVAQVESGGRSGFGPDGLPIIAYEGHIFRRYTKRLYDETHPLLSYPYKKKAGWQWQANNKDQRTAWTTLRSAIELDERAALLACSWGMCQVMGFNYAACGYADVFAFVEAMKRGSKGQLEAFVGYCRARPGMIAALRNKDYAAIAYAYNGEDYGNYDRLFERAYTKLKGK